MKCKMVELSSIDRGLLQNKVLQRYTINPYVPYQCVQLEALRHKPCRFQAEKILDMYKIFKRRCDLEMQAALPPIHYNNEIRGGELVLIATGYQASGSTGVSLGTTYTTPLPTRDGKGMMPGFVIRVGCGPEYPTGESFESVVGVFFHELAHYITQLVHFPNNITAHGREWKDAVSLVNNVMGEKVTEPYAYRKGILCNGRWK